MMATIPENQRLLHLLADELMMPGLVPMTNYDIGHRLRQITMDLSRKPRVTNAPVVSRHMTPGIAAQIRSLHSRDPTMTQQQIAVALGVGAGRVSETLAGRRR